MLLLTQHPHAIVIELHKKSAGDVVYISSYASANARVTIKNNSPRSISYSPFSFKPKKEEYTQSASIHCLSFRYTKILPILTTGIISVNAITSYIYPIGNRCKGKDDL